MAEMLVFQARVFSVSLCSLFLRSRRSGCVQQAGSAAFRRSGGGWRCVLRRATAGRRTYFTANAPGQAGRTAGRPECTLTATVTILVGGAGLPEGLVGVGQSWLASRLHVIIVGGFHSPLFLFLCFWSSDSSTPICVLRSFFFILLHFVVFCFSPSSSSSPSSHIPRPHNSAPFFSSFTTTS